MLSLSVMLDISAAHMNVPANRNIVAPIWLELDRDAFPHDHWTDFPVIILSWWASAARILLTGADSADLLFMDGPWKVNLVRKNSVVAVATAVEDLTIGPRICKSFLVNIVEVGKEISRAAKDLSDRFPEIGSFSPDVLTLRRAYLDLQTAIARF
jgi:hypothetical protein